MASNHPPSDTSSLGEEQPECPYILKAVKIKNDNMKSLKFGGTIEGLVTFEILWATDFAGVWLQLEGTALSRYKEGDAWQWKEKKARFVTLVSTILGTTFPSKKPIWPPPVHRLEAGEHTFPIKIEVTERVLPASFDAPFGAIQYRMVVYWEAFQNKDFWRYSSSLEQFFFKGYLDVHSEKSLNEPLTVTRKEGSFFSKKKSFKVRIELDRRGYTGGEKMNGTLIIDNPAGTTVLDYHLKFVQKIKHADSCLMKMTTTTMKEERKSLGNSKEKEIKSEFTLALPPKTMPTFRRVRHVIEIFYILQFCIRRSGAPDMKGETEIVVGTEQTEIAVGPPGVPPPPPPIDLPIPGKLPLALLKAGIPIGAAANAVASLPPSYSNLSSSSKSPPSYSTVCVKLDEETRKKTDKPGAIVTTTAAPTTAPPQKKEPPKKEPPKK